MSVQEEPDRQGRVLVVDDSDDDHFQIRRILQAEFQVFSAHSAAEALDRLARESFDVLITDQKMPRVSGDELIAQIAVDPKLHGLRCILLSGRTSDTQLVDILRGGRISRYMDKNHVILEAEGRAELVLAVRNAAQASRLSAEREALTHRLKSRVDALQEQNRLFRALVNQRDPSAVVRLLVESLAQRITCRAALGLLDLHPGPGVCAHIARGEGMSPLSRAEHDAWTRFTSGTFEELSGRMVPAPVFSSAPELERAAPYESGESGAGEARWAETVDESHTPRGDTQTAAGVDEAMAADLGERAPTPDSPVIPVFLNRDLRGVLVLVRSEPLAEDEQALFELWRDQLQDALSRVHTQILDERQRVELMVETMAEAVVLTDEHGAVTLVNPAARRILGLHELDRPDFTVIVSALGLSSLDVLRQLAQSDGGVAWREIRRGERFYHVLCSWVRDHAGAVVGILTVIRDVTDQKTVEQRREEFVHIIGHELRGPLTSIGGILDLLTKQVLGELTQRQLNYISMAKDSCNRISSLLNDLLDLAKFDQGKMPLNLGVVKLEQLVLDSFRKYEAVALERQISLRFDCPLEGLFLSADENRIVQVVQNLLTNALKATPPKGEITVSVFTAFVAPNHYFVAVHNTGEAIDEADLVRIFDRYEQVSSSAHSGASGTGLGLSICRNIIRGHAGEIWVESGAEEGTTFIFSLPSAQMGSISRSTTGLVASTSMDASASGQRVLLVAGEINEGLALKARLLQLGYGVQLCPQRVERVRDAIGRVMPDVAMYLNVDGQLEDAIMAELAIHTELPVIGVVPPGTPTPLVIDGVVEIPPESLVLASTLSVILGRQRMRRRWRVLLVHEDAAWIARVSEHLDRAGYLSHAAHSAPEALRRIETLLPDVVVLSASVPNLESIAARTHGGDAAEMTCVLIGESPASVEIDGCDGEVLPRDVTPGALLLALRGRLNRDRRVDGEALIVLPGAREVQREIQRRMRESEGFAYGALDIEGLKAGVDTRGFMWGRAVMTHTAELTQRVLAEHTDDRAFLGHQRDDDFVFLVGPEDVEGVCREISRAFARLEPVLRGADAEGPRLRLWITAIIDDAGHYRGYSTLHGDLGRARVRDSSELIRIERPKR